MADGVWANSPLLERPPTLSDRVTDELLAMIGSRRLSPGDRLPTERELGELFGVSRTVVREALRSLAAKGVLEVRTGSGATIARIGAQRASEAMRLYVQASRVDRGDGADVVTYAQINDVRAMIETKVAHIAAEQATEEALNEVAELHSQLSASRSESELTARLDVAFHRALAESTGNSLFVLMLDSIEPTLLDIRRATLGVPGRFQRAVDAHGLILERLRDRDPVGAAQAMADHLQDAMQIWQLLEGAERSEA